jgi:hypothetical protein
VFYQGYAADHFAAPRRWSWILALLVLGFAIRGPIGLVIPTGMLCSYYLLSGQWRRLFSFGLLASVLLLMCIGLLLWLADASGGPSFVQEVIRMQFLGRMDGSAGSSGVSYYFSSSLGNYALAYPLALLVLACVAATAGQHQGPAWRLFGFCTAAGLIVIIGLSIPEAKKARYLLPMLPMAAIVAAYPFQVAHGRVFCWLRVLMQGLWLLLPGLLIAGLLLAQRRFPEHLPSIRSVLILLSMLQLVALALMFRSRWRATGLAYCAVLAVWSGYILVFEPVVRDLYDTRTFTLAARDLIQRDPAPVVLHNMGKDAKAIKFMVNLQQDLQPTFTQEPQALLQVPGPAWVVMDKADFLALPSNHLTAFQPRLAGRFDKNDYVMLRLLQAQP